MVLQSVVQNVKAPNVALQIVATLNAKVQNAVTQIAATRNAVQIVVVRTSVVRISAARTGVRNAVIHDAVPSVAFQCAAIRVALIVARISVPNAARNVVAIPAPRVHDVPHEDFRVAVAQPERVAHSLVALNQHRWSPFLPAVAASPTYHVRLSDGLRNHCDVAVVRAARLPQSAAAAAVLPCLCLR